MRGLPSILNLFDNEVIEQVYFTAGPFMSLPFIRQEVL